MIFNRKNTSKTENYASGEAYKQTDKLEFVSILLGSFLKNQFYRSSDKTQDKLCELINRIPDKKFLAKTAIYARNEYGIRSATHLVAGELAKLVKKEKWTKDFYDKVIRRPDDILEILSYYLFKYNKPIPKSLRKGLAKSFDKFDEYKLAKYRGEGNAVRLVDAVNILHPVPTKKNADALKKLVKGGLKSFDTWESKLTQAGQKAETEEQKADLKKSAWKDLIFEKKIGYFALLRNLRNIKEQSPEALEKALELLTDRNLIKKSLVMPFRYLSAIKEIEQLSSANKILAKLSEAIDISLDNVPKIENLLVVLDLSGSMYGLPAERGAIFSAVLLKKNPDADIIVFGSDAQYKSVNIADSTLSIAKQFNFGMGGTDFHSIFQTANKSYDNIIILSDMQGWEGYDAPTKAFNNYKKKYNCSPKVFSFDLEGYGTMQFPERNVYCLAGFSDKVFDIMEYLISDKSAMFKIIDAIEL